MKKAAIIGCGLMGGSLGRALRQAESPWSVSVYARRPETRRQALEIGAADTAHDSIQEAVTDADIVIFCTPILTIPALLESAKPAFKPGVILTDVGSTKHELQSHCQAFLQGLDMTFIGSHPIAGSEQSGLEASSPDLYQNAVVVLTPSEDAPGDALAALKSFWTLTGARIFTMDTVTHDRLLAATSHVPHVVAALLADYVHSLMDEGVSILCGPGFRDTTRVASGSPDIWKDILQTNGPAIAQGLKSCRDRLDEWIRAVESADPAELTDRLSKCRQAREQLLADQDEL